MLGRDVSFYPPASWGNTGLGKFPGNSFHFSESTCRKISFCHESAFEFLRLHFPCRLWGNLYKSEYFVDIFSGDGTASSSSRKFFAELANKTPCVRINFVGLIAHPTRAPPWSKNPLVSLFHGSKQTRVGLEIWLALYKSTIKQTKSPDRLSPSLLLRHLLQRFQGTSAARRFREKH